MAYYVLIISIDDSYRFMIQSLLCIARFLLSDDDLVRARSIGVLHNISAEVTSLRLLREAMCISPIISLLTDASPEICQAAVGALQNISREEVSRLFMLEHGVVPKLVEILFSDNMQSQVYGLICIYLGLAYIFLFLFLRYALLELCLICWDLLWLKRKQKVFAEFCPTVWYSGLFSHVYFAMTATMCSNSAPNL